MIDYMYLHNIMVPYKKTNKTKKKYTVHANKENLKGEINCLISLDWYYL